MSLFDDDLSPDLRVLFDAERRRDEIAPPGAQDRVRTALAASIGVGLIGTATGAGAAKGAAVAAGAAGAGKAAAGAAAAGAGAGAVAGGAVGGGAAAAAGGAAVAAGTAAGGAAAAGGVTAAGGALAKGLAFALVAAMAGTAGTGVYLASQDDDKKAADTTVIVEKSPATDAAWDPSILGRKPEEPKALEEKPRPKVTAPVVAAAPTVERVAVAPKVETPEEKAERLAGERTILDEARAAVGRGDGSAALIALEAHRDHYADGALVEEREALTVLALAKLGRVDEAKAKAAKFRERFPSSLMLVAVNAAAPQD